MNIARLNELVEQGRLDAEQQLPALERAYKIALQTAGRHASERFLTFSIEHLTADATNPGWSPPENDQLIDQESIAADARRHAEKAHERALKAIIAPVLSDMGIAYDLQNPFVARLLDGLGARAQDMGDAVRNDVAKSILASYQQGLSVSDAAKAIEASVDGVSPARAAMLARTDLVGLANGASIAAAQAATGDGESAPFKQWLATEDERTRDSHSEADGQIVPLDQAFQVGGEQLMYPGDPDGSDEEVANCRCSVTYLDASEVSGGDLAAATVQSSDGLESGFLSGDRRVVKMVFRSSRHSQQDLRVEGLGDQERLKQSNGVSGLSGDHLESMDRVPVVGDRTTSVGLGLIDKSTTEDLSADLDHSKIGIDEKHPRLVPPRHGLPFETADRDGAFAVDESGEVGETLTSRHASDRGSVIADHLTDVVASAVTVDTSPEDTMLSAAVTVTVDDGEDIGPAEIAIPIRWRATLCVEGEESQDGPSLVRVLQPGGGTWRETPLPLGVMYETPHSDDAQAVVCGRIDAIYRDQIDYRIIWGEGIFNPDDIGAKAAEYVDNLSLRGISIDPYVAALTITELPVNGDEVDKSLLTFVEYVIGGATICPFQALENATIAIVASGSGPAAVRVITETRIIQGRGEVPALTEEQHLVASFGVELDRFQALGDRFEARLAQLEEVGA